EAVLPAEVPQRARAQVARVDEVAGGVAPRGSPEAHDAVLPRVLPRHEGGPGGRRNGWKGRAELAVATRCHQAGELGQLARLHHRPEEPEGRSVEPDHEYLPRHLSAPHAAARAARRPATSAESAR